MGADRKKWNVKEMTLNLSREYGEMAQVHGNVGITADNSLFKRDRL